MSLKTNEWRDSAGNNPLSHSTAFNGTAKAWASYTTVTSSAIKDSSGISSLTDNGGGNTTLTLASAMTNADYSCPTAYNLTGAYVASLLVSTKLANSVQLLAYYGAAGGTQDVSDNNVAILGDLA